MPSHFTAKKRTIRKSIRLGEIAHIIENTSELSAAITWVQSYLARPHAKLGRPGMVCPFAQTALAMDSLRIAVVKPESTNRKAEIASAINFHKRAFISRPVPEAERIFHATLILFPTISPDEAPELIDQVKEELKPSFLRLGLMLGEFHASNESPGLHNPDFKPLRSPIPMLAIRHMVPTDLVFLDRPEYDVKTRLHYLEAYLAVPHIPQPNRIEAERVVASLRAQV